jgi:hypothetical protein
LQQQSHKEALLTALRNGRAVHEQSAQYSSTSESNLTFSQFQTSLSVTHNKVAYHRIVQEFHPRDQDGIFSGDRICRYRPAFSSVALCIRSLLPFASLGIKVFDLTIFSVLALYFGKLNSNLDLIRIAISSYTSALKEFRQHISRVDPPSKSVFNTPGTSPSLLCLTMALQVFETINGVALSDSGIQAHVNGSLELIKLSNPLDFLAPPFRQVFSALRGILVRFLRS